MNWISVEEKLPPFDEKVMVILDVTIRNMGTIEKLTKYIVLGRYCCKGKWEFENPKVNISPTYLEKPIFWGYLPEITGVE